MPSGNVVEFLDEEHIKVETVGGGAGTGRECCANEEAVEAYLDKLMAAADREKAKEDKAEVQSTAGLAL